MIISILNSLKLIEDSFKKKFLKVVILLLFGTSLEIASLFSLIPIINSFQAWNQEDIYYESLSKLSQYLGVEIFFISVLSTISIFTIKAIYFSFFTFYQNNVVFNYSNFLSNKLYKIYLKKDYLFFKTKSIPSIIKDLNNEISNVTNYTISGLTLLVEIVTILAICITLFYIDFYGTLIIILSFLFSVLIYLSTFNKRLKNWGELRLKLDEKITENIFEKFEAIKDIKINSDYDFFQKEYNKFHSEKMQLLSKHLIVNQIPKVFFELIAIFSVSIASYLIFLYSNNIQEVVIFAGILVAGSFKLIPGINKILVSYQNMKFYIPSVRLIINEFESKLIENKTKYVFKNQIKLSNVNFSFGKNKVLNDVNLIINKGDIVGIFGDSGSGKTTLVDLICGLLKPSSGKILIDQIELKQNSKYWFKKIAYLSQDIVLKNDSILKNILNNNEFNEAKLKNSINFSNLSNFLNQNKESLNANIGPSGKKLSGGQKQRLALARTVYKDSEIIILDEPTSSLDSINEKKIIKSLTDKKLDKTIIIISHAKINEKLFDKIFKIENQTVKISK